VPGGSAPGTAIGASASVPAGADPDARLREEIVSSEVLHRGRTLTLRIDTVRRPDGTLRRREIAGHPGAVAVVAIDDDGHVLLVRQPRSATGSGRVLLEIPAGTLEVGPDGATEDPDGAARRELEEETGFRAATWRPLARFYTAPGFTDERMHLYLATDLSRAGADRLAPDEDEAIDLVAMAWADALAAADRGEIEDAKSLVGLLWVARLGGPPALRG
jgi:ADP-ribose pyrophosphatase